MSRLCPNFKCPNRITIGHNNDEDVINIICPTCERILYDSDTRQVKLKKRLRFLAPVFIVLLLISLIFITVKTKSRTDNQTVQTTPETNQLPNTAKGVITNFFQLLNNKKYWEAYQLTEHSKWNSLTTFQESVQYWNHLKVKRMEPKTYYSRYKADSIIYVVYSGVEDSSGKDMLREYDYHLKKFGEQWKIVRIYFPRDPETDILKNEEIPSSATEAVRLFLNFLNEQKYKKAYRLSNNKSWGGENEFISNNSFGCIKRVDITDIEFQRSVTNQLKVIRALYYATDPCNGSEYYSHNFYVSNAGDYWQITKVENVESF